MHPKLAGMKAEIENIKTRVNLQKVQHLKIDAYKLTVNHKLAIPYDPYTNSSVGTFERFHKNGSQVKLIIGAFGSGKSTACCAEIVLQACHVPPMRDGVRRSRWAIIRNTMGELESTALVTWLSWFRYLGHTRRTKKPLLTYTHTFRDNFGQVEMEIIFIGLDREDDKQKLESLELTGAYMNELQHIPRGIFGHVAGRIGRFPRQKDITGEAQKVILADTNPPDEDHWIYKDFEVNPIAGNTIFHQPPGLIKNDKEEWIDNPECDNKSHLAPTYYYDMARINHFREEFVKVYCRGEYGIVIPGKKVFPEYNDDLHSTDDITNLPDRPLLVCWDFGTTPCCLFVQFTAEGQMLCIKEFCTESSSVKSLAENVVVPYLNNEFKGYELLSIGDPAGAAKGQNFGIVTFDVLKEAGIETEAAKTNDIEPRIEAVKGFLNKMVDGQPGIVISRTGCPTLRKAMAGKYCYKRIRIIGDERYRDIPDKSHPWSDIADALEYAALEFGGDGLRIDRKPDVDLDEFTEANLTSGWV